MKKVLSWLLAAVMLLSVINFTAFSSFADTSADGKYDYYISGGKATFVKYNKKDDTGSFTVPEKIGKYPVTALEDFCFSQCSLSVITIPNSVLSVGDVAFEKCSNLTTVNFGAGMEKFGAHVFSEVPKLSSINVASANKHFKSIGGVLYNYEGSVLYAYPVAKADTHFTVPNAVKSVEAYAFDHALNLRTITIGTGMKAIGDRAFIGAFNVESITILSAATYIGNNAFGNINKLTSINIPDTVTYIGKEAFQDDNALKNLLIPSSVNYIGVDAFEATDPNFLVYCYTDSYAVSYCETYNIEYELVDSVLVSVAIILPPAKTEYCLDTQLDISGLVVSAVYSNGIVRTVTGYVVSGFDASSLGTKAVTVSFTDGGITRSTSFAVNVVAHKWERVGSVEGAEPTCTQEGLDLYECSVCGAEKQQAAPALGHYYVDDEWQEPTCTESGWKDIICKRCATVAETDIVVPPLGHVSDNYEKYTPATCTQSGEAAGICSRCGVVFDDILPALGHAMEEYTIAPGCTSDGAVITACNRCGMVETFRPLAQTGHDYVADVKAATCTAEGYTVYVCANCQNTYIADRMPALGHQYREDIVAATCTVSGYHYYSCERCSHVYYGMFEDAKGHNFSMTTVNPTSVKMGYTAYECTLCGYFYYGDVKDPTGPTSVIASCADTVEVGKTIRIKTDLTPYGIVDRISFASSNKKIATVAANGVVTGKSVGTVKIKCYVSNGKYKTLTVKVKTPATQIGKLISVAEGRLKVIWNQVDYADGYCVQYARDKAFKKNRHTKWIAGKKNTSVIYRNLQSGTRYYVRVAAYKTVSGQRSLSNWSKIKSIRVQ